MPNQLPTKPGLYVGRFGAIFRLHFCTWERIWTREDLYSNNYCPEGEVVRYMPLKKIEDSEQDD